MGQLHPTARGHRTVAKGDLPYMDGPTIEEIDVDDMESVDAVTQHLVYQHFALTAKMSILRDSISICFMKYGPNHSVKCRPLYIEYLRLLEQSTPHKFTDVKELHPELHQTTLDNNTTKTTPNHEETTSA